MKIKDILGKVSKGGGEGDKAWGGGNLIYSPPLYSLSLLASRPSLAPMGNVSQKKKKNITPVTEGQAEILM